MDKAFTVTQLTAYIKGVIDRDQVLNGFYIRGEISNFKLHSSGHMYFSLKDEGARIKCVIFRGHAYRLKFKPEDGMKIIARGSVSLYERDGQYQMYITDMQPDGIGSLYLKLEQLKKKLQKEGLFDAERKKSLPLLPRKIGVVTSQTGAVIRDIINVSTKRFNNISILLYPAKVQGEDAARSIARGIRYFNLRDDIDVIIVGRGGGSIEELWAFNEEEVVREVAESRIPVISAVGHETDWTLCDLAADIRASTPSHAAEIAVPSYDELKYKIVRYSDNGRQKIENIIGFKRYEVKGMYQAINIYSPENYILQTTQFIDSKINQLSMLLNRNINDKKSIFKLLNSKLDSLSPLKIIGMGYALVEKDGKSLKGVKDVGPMDEIKVIFNDGSLDCKVLNVMEGNLCQREKKD